MKSLLNECSAILISDPINIMYLIGDFGFSITERECYLFITKKRKYIITDKRYSSAITKKIKDYEIIDTGVNKFLNTSSQELFKKNKVRLIGIESKNLTVAEYNSLSKFVKTKNIDSSNLRIIKNKNEIKKIIKACRVSDQAFKYIINKIEIGVTEKELSFSLENFIKSQKAELSFKPIIGFGTNSSVPHHLSSGIKLKKNQIILMDFGVKFDNYCSDMTRTIYFGKASDKFKKIYETVLEAQKISVKYLNAKLKNNEKVKFSEIDKVGRKFIEDKGYPNIPHALGHGIGMEVHEKPDGSSLLKNGMVFSIEPGIYLQKYGGVRIEDLVLVRAGRAELISRSKREIIELNV